jgi:hypothetical protein
MPTSPYLIPADVAVFRQAVEVIQALRNQDLNRLVDLSGPALLFSPTAEPTPEAMDFDLRLGGFEGMLQKTSHLFGALIPVGSPFRARLPNTTRGTSTISITPQPTQSASNTCETNMPRPILPVKCQAPPLPAKSAVFLQAMDVVLALRNRDTSKLATWKDPQVGLTLTPNSFLVPDSIHLSTAELLTALQNPQEKYPIYFGSRQPGTFAQYYDNLISDKDYADVFPDSQTVEIFFPGDVFFAERSQSVLRLIFQQRGEESKLVAIIHSEWTP